jgi:hypothetical protein
LLWILIIFSENGCLHDVRRIFSLNIVNSMRRSLFPKCKNMDIVFNKKICPINIKYCANRSVD